MPAYAGTYKGDISKFSTEEVALTLTVNKAQNDGKLTDVTSAKEFSFTADTTTFSATIPAVEVEKQSGESQEQSGESQEQSGESQEHSGDDAYSEIQGESARVEIYDGDTLDETIFYEFEGSDEAKSSKAIDDFGLDLVERGTYIYTYDRDKRLIQLNLQARVVVENKADNAEGVGYANADEAIRVYEKFVGTPSEAQKALITAKAAAAFHTTEMYKFIRHGETSVTLVPYFDGRFPTAIRFAPDTTNGNAINLTLRNGGIQFTAYAANGEVAYTYEVYPTFNTETFSGTLYRTANGNVESMGTIAGEYHFSAQGTVVGTTIDLLFTTIPAGVSQIATETHYAFRQVYVIGVGNKEPEVTDDNDSVAGSVAGKLYYAPYDFSAEYKSASQYTASVAFSIYSFALGDDTLTINTIESARRQGYDNEAGVIIKDNNRSQDTFNYTQKGTTITLTKDPRTITVYANDLKLHDPNSDRDIPLYPLDAEKVFAWSEATVSDADKTAHTEIVYFTLKSAGYDDDGNEVGFGVYVSDSFDANGQTSVRFNYTISDNTFTAKHAETGEIIGTGDVTSHDEYTFFEKTHTYQNML